MKKDERYFRVPNEMQCNRVEDILDQEESVLLRVTPDRRAYILNAVFKMMPVAILWAAFDIFFIVMLVTTGIFAQLGLFSLFLAGFFLLHLAPLWVWIAGIVRSVAEYKNIEYVFTEKRVILRSGLVGIDFKNIYYSDIEGVNLKVGIIDRICHVGDIYIQALRQSSVLFDVKNPYLLLAEIQRIVHDIKTDIAFPNALRPAENTGFRTKYVPEGSSPGDKGGDGQK